MISADASNVRMAESSRNRRVDRLASGILLSIAVTCLLYGALRGDVTSAEASLLESVRGTQPGFESADRVGAYARLLAWTQPWTAVTVQGLRCVSTVGLIALVGFLFAWLDREIGRLAGGLAALAVAFSAPAFLLSGRGTGDVVLAGAIMLGIRLLLMPARARSLAAETGDHEAGSQSLCAIGSVSIRLLGAAILGVSAYLVVGAEGTHSVTGVSFGLALASALTLAFPSLLALGLLFGRGFPGASTRPERSALRIAAAWVIWGLAPALLAPKLHLGGALMMVAGSAVLVAIAWRRSAAGGPEISEGSASLPLLLAVGLPTAALVAAMARIALDYHFMERVQAIAVVALFSIPIVAWLARRERRQWLWLPIAALAVVCRIVYVNAYLPERDHWQSPKAYARAVASQLPPGTTLHTDLASDAAFRHYLGIPVVPIDGSELKPAEPGPHYALLTTDALRDDQRLDPRRWRLVRSYIGPTGQTWVLVGSASSSTPELATEGGRSDSL